MIHAPTVINNQKICQLQVFGINRQVLITKQINKRFDTSEVKTSKKKSRKSFLKKKDKKKKTQYVAILPQGHQVIAKLIG